MAQTEVQPQGQEKPEQSGASAESPFSLFPAIFTPFSGFTSAEGPDLDQTQRLQKIIENLQVQQDAVRKNMLFLIQQRAETLTSKARVELEILEKETDGDEELELDEDKERKEREKREIDDMFERLNVPSKKDGKSEHYKANLNAFEFNRQHPATPPPAGNGGVEMSGTDNPRRTAKVVREELSGKIRELVDRGTQELEAYDVHAQEALNHYRKALERRTGRPAPMIPMGTATVPSKGILKNANDGDSVPRLERRRSVIRFADDP